MPLQDVIHKWTEGSGSRVLALVLVAFGMLGLAVWYDAAAFKNLSTIEGMDAAQLGRNISRGDGYTTQFVRPLSIHLLKKHRGDEAVLAKVHPDLANAPVYPLLLAGVLAANPFGFPDTTSERRFSIYRPDLWIAMFNQLLLLVAVWMVFRLGRRLFDEQVAWVAAVVLAGSELFWRFSTSGLSTILLMVLFLGIVDVLSRIEPQTREGATRGPGWMTGMAVLAGLLAGLAGLTRYSFAWIIVPVVVFLALLPTPRRTALLMSCILTFLAVLSPWVARNYIVSGTPFGTAGYALLQNTSLFTGFDLERTLNPDFSLVTGPDFWRKLLAGLREIIERELPRLGGSWVSAFFLVGLLVPFRSPTLSRLRIFVVLSILVFGVVQALGRTGLSADSAEVNSENLLAVLAPGVFLFGVSLFFVLLQQFGLNISSVRIFAMAAFAGIVSLPMIFTLFTPLNSALAYPPYYPPFIQEKANSLDKDALVMSDMPWAVAWYGNRQSVWLSLKYREDPSLKFKNDFHAVSSQGKPVRALYLSARSTKSIETRALAAWMEGVGSDNWEQAVSDWDTFVLLGVYLKHEVPTGFPLKRAPFGLQPELFLSDSERIQDKPIQEQ